VQEARVFGAIGVLEMKESLDVARVQAMLVERGVWLRPFGKLLYTMPPYVMSNTELAEVTGAMREVAASLQI
jgi:adenosylmethionine-8-amino-7-oxononanoate aminotransferase